MKTVGAFEAKTHFSSLLEQVEAGEQIIITKHGHAVAKLVPISTSNQKHIENTIDRLQAFCQSNTLGKLDWRKLRDEGRR